MYIWPWRSRPTVQPWNENFNVASADFPIGLTPIHPAYIVPDNVYAQPIHLRIVVTNVAGARVNQFINFDITRASRLILHSAYHFNTGTGTIALTYAVGFAGIYFATDPLHSTQYFPDHLLLLPADTFTVHITGGLAGDTLDQCTITTKFWEIY